MLHRQGLGRLREQAEQLLGRGDCAVRVVNRPDGARQPVQAGDEPAEPLLELLHGRVEAALDPRDEALRGSLARLLEELEDLAAVRGVVREADGECNGVVVDRAAVVRGRRPTHALRLEQDGTHAHRDTLPLAPDPAPAGIALRISLYASSTRPSCVPSSSSSAWSRSTIVCNRGATSNASSSGSTSCSNTGCTASTTSFFGSSAFSFSITSA